MTFFKLLGRTFSSFIIAWIDGKKKSKAYGIRVLVFSFALLFASVWIPMWYYKVYLPYEGYELPPLSKMNVDNGIWVSSHDKNKLDYVLTADGRKILFNHHNGVGEYRKNILTSQGLNPLSMFDPKIHVKVWWISKPNKEANLIGQLEVEGKMFSSYSEMMQNFFENRDHWQFYLLVKILLSLIISMFLWEFLVQYIKYRQERNVLSSSE